MSDSHNQIKAVLFDLGETILCFGKIDRIRLFRQGARLSYDFLQSLQQTVSGFEFYYLQNLVLLYIHRLSAHITRKDFNSLALLRGFGVKKGYNLDSSQWQQFAWMWYEPLRRIANIEPDIKQTLLLLKNSGLKLGIVSNTFVNADSLDRHLEQLGILDFFELRMYSYKFAFRKPDLRLFKIASEKIGEAMQNILYVGDRIDNDVRPALKAGMHSVLKAAYTNKGKTPPKGVARINLLSELPQLIERINAGARC
jgi:HAD superfamily hydrolase (TIGR01549 family)